MPEAFNIGPFLFPTMPVAVIVALLLAIVTSGFIAGRIGLPTTVFIGADGVVADRYVGELSRASLENGIEAMLSRAADG